MTGDDRHNAHNAWANAAPWPEQELIDTGTDKRYVRRNTNGQFNESDDVGRSLIADRRKKAKKVSKPGQGDKGDRPKMGRSRKKP